MTELEGQENQQKQVQNNPRVYEFRNKPSAFERFKNRFKKVARIGATASAITSTATVGGIGVYEGAQRAAHGLDSAAGHTSKIVDRNVDATLNAANTGLDVVTYPFADHENVPNEPVVEIFDGELILNSSFTNPDTGEKVTLNLRRKPETVTKFDTGQQSDEANKINWNQIVDFRGKDIVGIKNPEIVHGINADGTKGVGRWARFKVRISDPLGRDDETFVYAFVGDQTAEVINLKPNNPDKQYIPASEFSNPDHPVETNVLFTPELTSISK